MDEYRPCPKRHPIDALRCTKGLDHKGGHAFADRVQWTDDEARQTLAILAGAYGGVISWPEEGTGARRLPCGRCKKSEYLRECVRCGVKYCHACLFVENCPHSQTGQHALPVERPM
jgi:hypothetical protein